MTLPGCPRCAAPVEPDWDWCQQCGYDPDGLKAERDEVGAVPGRPAPADKEPRSRKARKKAATAAAVSAAPVDPRPPPPRRPTETVYGMLPYDNPSSVSPVEPDAPDNSERINRRFTIVALCVIVVGLVLLVTALIVG